METTDLYRVAPVRPVLEGTKRESAKTRLSYIRVTAFHPSVDHAVSDEEMGARDRQSRGEYRALCGTAFLPAPDTRPPGALCPACARILRARATLAPAERRLGYPGGGRRGRHARQGWWSRWWCDEPASGGAGG